MKYKIFRQFKHFFLHYLCRSRQIIHLEFFQMLKDKCQLFVTPPPLGGGGVTTGNRLRDSAYDACLCGASSDWAALVYLQLPPDACQARIAIYYNFILVNNLQTNITISFTFFRNSKQYKYFSNSPKTYSCFKLQSIICVDTIQSSYKLIVTFNEIIEINQTMIIYYHEVN